ncbi:hypothetical protein AB0H34_36365, partial [Saccharopolyspora shandongensis]|uniref:hypothetical protein n=1 Tax=Saccharopolyspora shandongensis TaxID=418495 RepID=UPI0033D609A2
MRDQKKLTGHVREATRPGEPGRGRFRAKSPSGTPGGWRFRAKATHTKRTQKNNSQKDKKLVRQGVEYKWC